MMRQFTKSSLPGCLATIRSDERGIFFITLAGILISMLIILGLAVDSGTLYNGQLATQAAADAAASSGAALLATGGAIPNVRGISLAMSDMASTNLIVKGVPTNPPPIIIPNVTANAVSIQITAKVGLRILRFVPGFGQMGTVNATARARVRPAVVSLILDTSYSMCCQAGGGACNPSASCVIAGSKLEDLQNAVIAFLDHFDDAKDSIDLIPFALGAELLVPFSPLGTGFPKAFIRQQVLNLVPGGATNPSDAFIQSYLDVERIGAQKQVAYVYFSDGAPTAARLMFKKDIVDPVVRVFHSNNPLRLVWTDYDFLSYATFNGTPGAYLSVPYFFVYSPELSDWNPRLHTDALPPPQAKVVIRGPDPLGEAIETFSNFTMQLIYRLPDGSDVHFGRSWDYSVTPHQLHWEWFHYREEYFNYALALADFARDQGGSWYAVGVGDSAPMSLNELGQPDHYQNADRDFDRKDIFLTRLANDSCGMVRGDPSFVHFSNYNQLAAEGKHEGMYLATPSSDELKSLFDAIARRIKMQLIE